MTLTGECFCGEIKYKITGPLVDPLSCHCSRCRKAFSAQSSNYARVDSGDFHWLPGGGKLTSYAGKNGFGLLFCFVESKASWDKLPSDAKVFAKGRQPNNRR